MENAAETNELSRLVELIPHFRAPSNTFDEVFSRVDGQARAWYRLLIGQSLSVSSSGTNSKPLTPRDVTERWQTAKEQLQEHAATVFESVTHRNSEVDPIPFIIDGNQWQFLSKGIAQRARLLDRILRDVYGPQTLLEKGLLPHELVYGTHAYLGAMRGTLLPDRPMLSLYAAQLCRDVTGTWYVLADRTQGPSGGGYSVENRIALSRVLPEEFRDMLVQRSAPFFTSLRDSMNRSAVSCQGDSWMVLMSPGIRSSTYFEDAYLARYLGYTLAQSNDLTVRGGQVFLKTLGGLKRVSNILRRVPDQECDPLELAASAIGVPGLCQAVRDHQVAISNHLGSGWAEIPALMAILPRLCHELLDEDLILPSWPTWWCGDPSARQFVESQKESMIFRNAFEKRKETGYLRHRLDPIQTTSESSKRPPYPWEQIASRVVPFSTTPCWLDNQVVGLPMVMRVFATSVEGDYQVLPGGIARVGQASHPLDESLSSGQMSKDVWVLGDSPVPITSLRRPPQSSLELRRTSFELPSRVADELYWLGRCSERAAGMVRHARFCANRLSGEIDLDVLPVLSHVVDALEEIEVSVKRDVPASDLLAALRAKLVDFVFSGGNSSLPGTLIGVRRNASLIRDRLSSDSWHFLSRLEIEPVTYSEYTLSDVQPKLSHLLDSLTAFAGLVVESMTRGPGWLFLDMGRRIERMQHQLRLINQLLVPVYPRITPLLEAMLDIMDSSITYRYRYLMNIEIGPVLDLLLQDQSNPRSMVFQLLQLDEHLEALLEVDNEGISIQRNSIQECLDLLLIADINDATFSHPTPSEWKSSATGPHTLETRLDLARLSRKISNALSELAEYLTKRFFTHTAHVQQLGKLTK